MGSSGSKKRTEKRRNTVPNSEPKAPDPPPMRTEQPTGLCSPNGHVITNRDVQDAISHGNNICTLLCYRLLFL